MMVCELFAPGEIKWDTKKTGAFSWPGPDSNSSWTATVAACGVAVGWEPTKQNRRGWRPRGTSGVRMRKSFKEKEGKVGIMRIYLWEVGLLDCRAPGRLGCVRVLSDPDRRNVLDPGHLDGGDVATCPGLLKVNAECVRVLSDPDRRNVLDPGNLDGGEAATCPGILYLGPGSLLDIFDNVMANMIYV
ncbi:hypothetical protein AgCh_009778 [Apium graveolens]